MRSLVTVLIFLVAACGSSTGEAPILFGPGPGWIADVTEGEVRFSAESRVEVDVDGDLQTDLTFDMTGEATVWRSDAYESDPLVTLGRRDRLDLEIVSMQLMAEGLALRAGDGLGNGRSNNSLSSRGSSQEVADMPAMADDRLEIFFEVELGGAVLHNEDALIVESTITQLPPLQSTFVQTGAPVTLIDANNDATMMSVVRVEFTPLERLPDE